jgi:hypothetical protein
MPQTTTSINGAAATISIKVAAGSYVDISGSTQSVDAATATVLNSEAYTLDGSNSIVYVGKFEPVEVTVNVLYTETTTTEAYMIISAAFAAKSAVQLKWVPRGAASGANTIETMATGYITSLDFPAVDASSADALMASFVVKAPGITYTDVT